MITLIENKLFAFGVNHSSKSLNELLDEVKDGLMYLGTVTADEITFDVGPYVEGNNSGILDTMWKDYTMPTQSFAPFQCVNKKKSFRTLLQSRGIVFVNPLAKPIIGEYENGYDEGKQYRNDLSEWQGYEKRLVKKVVILERVAS